MSASAAPALSAGGLFQVFLSLGVVLLAIFALAWLSRRLYQLRGTAGALRLRGGLQVGPKERVVVLQAGETTLLLGVGAGGVRTLHVFDTTPEWLDEEPATNTPPFARRLAELMAQSRGRPS